MEHFYLPSLTYKLNGNLLEEKGPREQLKNLIIALVPYDYSAFSISTLYT